MPEWECPYCGHLNAEDMCDLQLDDGKPETLTCGKCEREATVTLWISQHLDAEKKT